MTSSRSIVVVLAVVAATLFGELRAARAETPEQLFDRGSAAMERKDYVEACGLFDRSYTLSRATGPLQGLAACHEARGLLKQSLQLWREAERTLPPDSPSRAEAAAAIARLQQSVALVSLKLSDAAPSSSRVELDGEVVTLEGAPLEVDPVVQHVVETKAAGHASTTITFRIAAGGQRTIIVGPGPELTTERRSAPIGLIRGTGIALTALGAVGLTVAAVTSGIMLSQQSTIDQGCVGAEHTDCDAAAVAASADAKGLGPWNAAAWIVGIGALGAGIPMIVVGDDKAGSRSAKLGNTLPSKKVELTLRGVGLSIDGRF